MRAAAPRILGRQDTPATLAQALAQGTLRGLEGDSLAVLDPSCGAGPLLVAAALEVAATARADSTRRTVSLLGIDKDPGAIEETRAALAEHGLEATLAVGDALEGDESDVLALLGRPARVDVVLANPPWVSFSGRESVALSRPERARLRARFESFGRWPQLQGPFLERALELVRPGGRVGFVLPRQALDLEGYGPLRRAATARGRLLDVRDLGEGVFAGVCEPVATVVLERPRDASALVGRDERWLVGASSGRAEVDSARSSTLARWAARTLEKLARFPRFPRALVSDPGVHTGNAADVLLRDRPARGFVPCREGKDVRAFELAAPRRFVREKPRLERPLYARVGPRERFHETDVLVRQTADRPIACRHEPRAHFRNSALAVRVPRDLEVEVVLALLNSHLFALDHRARTADARQRAFPQVKVGALAALPFPASLPVKARAQLVRLVRAREERRDRAEGARIEGMLESAVSELFGLDADARRALAAWRP